MDINATSGLSPLALGRMLGSAGQSLDASGVSTSAADAQGGRDWFGFEGWSGNSASIGIDTIAPNPASEASASVIKHILG